ncbi:MAG TPA: DUF1501 domain-containing protein, partial [Planctomycetaceae bacterium]|nr:DUF1501 domain-containing protein [Planctomycetaceae bacterium]
VVIQLSGGNDGLNTVVPFSQERYYAARPTLAIPKSQVLKINDQLGLHPSLDGFEKLLQAESLAIIQGVGYPEPNRSHFESMDIWHTCHRKGQPREDGWLGRYLDMTVGLRDGRGVGDGISALHLGEEKQPLALRAQETRVASVQSLKQFRLAGGGIRQLQELIGSAKRDRDAAANALLDFVQDSTQLALTATERLESATGNYKTEVKYPETPLARKLSVAAQLIHSKLNTRIFYVTLDGFDTHSRQADAHAALLSQLGDALQAFMEDLREHGHAGRVLTVCFSEFGRRVQENASQGTDHGAAGPMFLIGPGVQAGLHGKHPSLEDLVQGDLQHAIDFRQVYATILDRWLACPSQQILGGEFAPLPLLRCRRTVVAAARL